MKFGSPVRLTTPISASVTTADTDLRASAS